MIIGIVYKAVEADDRDRFYLLTTLQDVTSQIPLEDIGYSYFIYEPFWVGGTLYFQTGGESWGKSRYVAIKPLVERDEE